MTLDYCLAELPEVRRMLQTRFEFACANRSDIEDAVQDAIVRYIVTAPTLKADADLAAWLSAVARHILIDQHRGSRTNCCSLGVDVHSSIQAPEFDFAESVVDRMLLREAIRALSSREREIILLVSDGYTCPEISITLGITEAAAFRRLSRARKHLKTFLS